MGALLYYVPITKSQEESVKGEKRRIVEGIASTEDEDATHEVVVQDGIDPRPLLEKGFFNWDHKEGPENIIGEPLEVKIVEGPATWVRGWLYEGHPRADAVWSLLQAMEKGDSSRRIAWSVQGREIARQGNRILGMVLEDLALTDKPVNGMTFARIAKSMAAMSTESANDLLNQNLDDGMTNLLWGSCNRRHFDKSGRFRDGLYGAMEHLVKCKGVSVPEAKLYLSRLLNSGIFPR